MNRLSTIEPITAHTSPHIEELEAKIAFEDDVWATKTALLGLEEIKKKGLQKASAFLYQDAHIFSKLLDLDRENLIPEKVRCEAALFHYDDQGDLYPNIHRYVRKSLKYRPDDWDADMPEVLRGRKEYIVYRGGGEPIDKVRKGLSWSLSRDIAEFVAERKTYYGFEAQHIYRGVIDAENIIAYLSGRNEFEIVQYNSVRDIEELPPIGMTKEYMALRDVEDSDDRDEKLTAYVCRQILSGEESKSDTQ